jgi:hypothetical protein
MMSMCMMERIPEVTERLAANVAKASATYATVVELWSNTHNRTASTLLEPHSAPDVSCCKQTKGITYAESFSDSKSAGPCGHGGSTPPPGTNKTKILD